MNEERAVTLLTDAIESYAPSPADLSSVVRRASVLRRRRIAAAGGSAALIAVVAVAAGVVIVARTGTHGPTRPLAPAPTIHTLPPSPLDGRYAASSAWTGSQWFVWGGSTREVAGQTPFVTFVMRKDGALFNPVSNEWQRVAPSPLSARAGAVALPIGNRILVAGGADLAADVPTLHDGAWYAPRSDTWKPAPQSPTCPDTGLVRSDRAYVLGSCTVFRKSAPHGRVITPGFALFDAGSNRWRSLSVPPIEGPASLQWWKGSILASTAYGTFARYDVRDDAWTPLPDLPGQMGSVETAVVGDRIFAVGSADGPPGSPAFVFTNEGWSTLGRLSADAPDMPDETPPRLLVRSGENLGWSTGFGVAWFDTSALRADDLHFRDLGLPNFDLNEVVQPTTPGTVIIWGGQNTSVSPHGVEVRFP